MRVPYPWGSRQKVQLLTYLRVEFYRLILVRENQSMAHCVNQGRLGFDPSMYIQRDCEAIFHCKYQGRV